MFEIEKKDAVPCVGCCVDDKHFYEINDKKVENKDMTGKFYLDEMVSSIDSSGRALVDDNNKFIITTGLVVYLKEGHYHRTDGPAMIYSNGVQKWMINGELHRTDGPAAIFPSGEVERWENGKRIDSFAKLLRECNADFLKESEGAIWVEPEDQKKWFTANPTGKFLTKILTGESQTPGLQISYFRNGELYRENGPKIVSSNAHIM